MRKTATYVLSAALVAVVLIAFSDRAESYDVYTGSLCATCHNGFEGKNALHDVHVKALTSNCNMCHPSGPGSTPVSTFSAGDATAFSCLGCHGRDYGGSIGKQAAGLRLHHANTGTTVCAGCHPSDPTPLAESVLPPHYGRGDVTLTDPCADNLDNDGDLLVDGNDPDCQVAVEPTTWSRIKALYAN